MCSFPKNYGEDSSPRGKTHTGPCTTAGCGTQSKTQSPQTWVADQLPGNGGQRPRVSGHCSAKAAGAGLSPSLAVPSKDSHSGGGLGDDTAGKCTLPDSGTWVPALPPHGEACTRAAARVVEHCGDVFPLLPLGLSLSRQRLAAANRPHMAPELKSHQSDVPGSGRHRVDTGTSRRPAAANQPKAAWPARALLQGRQE